MTRGRKPGSTLPESAQARLASMKPGDVRWIDTTLHRWQNDMRVALVPRSRRHGVDPAAEFSARLYTAVSASTAGDIHYLIRLERTK